MGQQPYLNLGCGRIILPAARPAHHALVDEAIYAYPLWVNADRNAEPGVDCVMDAFAYPWPWDDNSFDGALLTHLVEHIPHEIKPSVRFDRGIPKHHNQISAALSEKIQRYSVLSECQDGWYAFFAELYRVLSPGAVVHIVSPYGWSQGGITDPSHTRLITEHTFTHSMQPDPTSPFRYETGGINFAMTQPAVFKVTELFEHLIPQPALLEQALRTQINVAYELYVKLRAVK